MTTMYTIDISSRALEVGVAEVTECDLGLIVRPQAELGRLEDLVAKATRENPLRLDSPILLTGDGYQAQSSAGFVSVDSWSRSYPCRDIVAGTYRRTSEIRPHRPVSGGVLPPSTVWADSEAGWRIEAVASILMQQSPEEVVIAEGQSNWARGYHFLASEEAWSEHMFNPAAVERGEWGLAEGEWRQEVLDVLRVKNYAAALLRAAHRALRRTGQSAPLAGARESLLQTAAAIRNQELDEFLAGHLSRGYWQTARPSTWEVATIGQPVGEGRAVDGNVRSVPLTIAQMGEMNRLVAEGRQEEANELWRQSALDLDLPIEDWERELLVKS